MKDWKGNEVEIGDTIRIVKIGEFEQTASLVMINFKDHTSETLSTFHKDAQENLWIPSPPVTIVESGPQELGNNKTWTYNFFVGEWMFTEDKYHILCIEGKSFDRDEYYLEKFKVK